MKSFKAQEMMELIESYKITMVSGAPSLYHILLQLPELESYDTRSVTSCSVGASICPQETKYRLTKLFRNASGVFDVYGATGLPVTSRSFKQRIGNANQEVWAKGYFSPAYASWTALEQMCDGPDRRDHLRGPNIMEGYYKMKKQHGKPFAEGGSTTGDLGKMDEEGYLYIVGRLKDTIISGGENIYPREVEEILYTHPKIQEAAVIGVPDPKWGETVKAVVVLNLDKKATEEEIILYCKQKIALTRLLNSWILFPNFQRPLQGR